MEQQNDYKKNLEFIAVLAIFVLVVFVLLFIAKRAVNPNTPTAPTQPDISPSAVLVSPSTAVVMQDITKKKVNGTGTIMIETKDGKTTYKVGESITLVIKATSVDAIVGYDVVLPVDQKGMALLAKKEINPDFQFLATLSKSNLSITGSKKLSVKTPTYLKDSPLFELVIKLVKKGTLIFKPVFIAPGKTSDSNLINSNTDDVLQDTTSLTITVE